MLEPTGLRRCGCWLCGCSRPGTDTAGSDKRIKIIGLDAVGPHDLVGGQPAVVDRVADRVFRHCEAFRCLADLQVRLRSGLVHGASVLLGMSIASLIEIASTHPGLGPGPGQSESIRRAVEQDGRPDRGQLDSRSVLGKLNLWIGSEERPRSIHRPRSGRLFSSLRPLPTPSRSLRSTRITPLRTSFLRPGRPTPSLGNCRQFPRKPVQLRAPKHGPPGSVTIVTTPHDIRAVSIPAIDVGTPAGNGLEGLGVGGSRSTLGIRCRYTSRADGDNRSAGKKVRQHGKPIRPTWDQRQARRVRRCCRTNGTSLGASCYRT
jgi:hypothetical protein